jgi:hypothetical protein
MSSPPPNNEEQLLELIRALDVRAPEALHERVDGLVREHDRPRRRAWGSFLRPLPALGAAAAVAALVVVLLLVLGGSPAPSTSPLLRPAVLADAAGAGGLAPVEDTSDPRALAAAVGGVRFPYWQDTLGWRASGARAQTLLGRPSTTVYYTAAGGERVGYTIVGGAPLAALRGGTAVWRGGTAYHLLEIDGLHAIAWLRGGHACVIAGRGASRHTLLRLAALSA